MHPENIKTLEECWAGKRLAFMTTRGPSMAVVTIPTVSEDPDLYQGMYLLLQDKFTSIETVEEFMRGNKLLYVSPFRTREV